MRFNQRLPLDVALPNRELGPLWPVISVIVRLTVTAVPEAKETTTFRETTLKAQKELHHSEVPDDLPSIVVILQGTQQHLDTGVVPFEMRRVSHWEKGRDG